jgi:predicted DCC family thiol-disulfide oxidoreductase YuxK
LPEIQAILQVVDKPGCHIVLYDGVCNLCTGVVRFIIKRDPHAYFSFASLQSEMGKTLLDKYLGSTGKLGSVVLIADQKAYIRTDAVLMVLRHLSGGWRLFSVLLFVPRPLRDLLYELVARTRYLFFGTRSTCLVSLPGWEDRFLG